MKYWFLALALAFGFALTVSPAPVHAGGDSDSGDSGKTGGSSVPELDPTAAGAAIVLMLGGVAYIASRRRKNDAG